MISISDLRKGNLIKTEYGILPVHAIIFNEVQVKGNDGRILWAKETKYLIGESFDQDIKELREKGMIEPCAGMNGWLIKIINLNIWNP